MNPMRKPRVADTEGPSYQIRRAVRDRSEELERAIIRNFPSLAAANPSIQWVFPDGAVETPAAQERDFLRVLGRRDLWPRLATFWPRQSPTWAALARVDCDLGQGVLLLDARSRVDDSYSDEAVAKSDVATDMVHEALQRTKKWVGADPDLDWAGPVYSIANRLVHLYFFREIARVPAWYASICFIDDPASPTTTDQWVCGLANVRRLLGVTREPDQIHADFGSVLMVAER